jgi:diguanylate cyclase (GGDEF)-like protein
MISDGDSSAGELVTAIRAAAADGAAACLVAVDIDHFLALAEAEGAEAAELLIASAERMIGKAADANGWTLVRSGGDEFHLVMPDVTLEHAFLHAERLRTDLERTLGTESSSRATPTASLGVANMPRDAKTPEELIRRAYDAVFAAKEQGGNVVALTPASEMVVKTSYYEASQLARLKALAGRLGKKEAALLREALDDLLRKYDRT